MRLRFPCPECAAELRVDPAYANRRATCPKCSAKFRVPAAPDVAASSKVAFAAEHAAAHAPPAADESIESDDDNGVMPKSSFSIDHDELIDMTAMVDIVFFLLIFFLVTSMHALDSAVPMPKPGSQKTAAAGARATEPETVEDFEDNEEYIVVHIDRNDALEIDGIPVLDLSDLVRRVNELRGGPPHPDKMLVVGDGLATHGTMVSVLDAGRDAGIERVRMAVTGQNDE